MYPAVQDNADQLSRLCNRYGVQRLELFGSAAISDHLPSDSELDFVVEFQPAARETYAESYFGLRESLEELFERPVDLVVGSAIKNPYFAQSIGRTKTLVYEA